MRLGQLSSPSRISRAIAEANRQTSFDGGSIDVAFIEQGKSIGSDSEVNEADEA